MATSKNDPGAERLVEMYVASTLEKLCNVALGGLDEGAKAYGLVYLGKSRWKLLGSPEVPGSEHLNFVVSGPGLSRAGVVQVHEARIVEAQSDHAELVKTLKLITAAGEGGPEMEKLLSADRQAKAQQVAIEASLRTALEALRKARELPRRGVDGATAQALRDAEAVLEEAETAESTALEAAKSARLFSKKKAWTRHQEAQARTVAARVARAQAAKAASAAAEAASFNEGNSQQVMHCTTWVKQLRQELAENERKQDEIAAKKERLRERMLKKIERTEQRMRGVRPHQVAKEQQPSRRPEKEDDGLSL